jgi:hypothetical protein
VWWVRKTRYYEMCHILANEAYYHSVPEIIEAFGKKNCN